MNIPNPTFDGNANLTKRLRFIEDTKNDFWKKWYAQVFHNLVPENIETSKWEILYCSESPTPGEDGKVREVTLNYKNLEETRKDVKKAVHNLLSTKFSETERSVQNIAVIVPADWQENEIEDAVTQGLKVF